MNGITELLATHGVENEDFKQALETYVNKQLATAGGNSIPKSRFDEVLTQRKEANAKVSELELQIKTLEEKTQTFEAQLEEATGYKTKYETYMESVNKEKLGKWEGVKKVIYVKEDHPRFKDWSKVYDQFNFEDEATPEQVEANMKTYELLNKTGFFGDVKPDVNDDPARKVETKKYKSPFRK